MEKLTFTKTLACKELPTPGERKQLEAWIQQRLMGAVAREHARLDAMLMTGTGRK